MLVQTMARPETFGGKFQVESVPIKGEIINE